MNVITTQMRTDVSKLYVSLFGRAPDSEGLGYWVNELAAKSFAEVANSMYATSPARAYYPSWMTNAEIVTSFYVNTLGRTPDDEGKAYWTAKLNAANGKVGSVIAEMIQNVINYNGDDAEGLASQALFVNKVAVAQYYGEKNGAVSGATAVLATVTADEASVEAAKAHVDGVITTVPPQTLTLTTGIDTLTGGKGNDTFNALIGDKVVGGALVSAGTLSPLDTLNGAEGADVLNVLDQAGASAITGVITSSIETVNVRSVGAVNVDTTVGFSGVTTLNVTQGAAVVAKAAGTTGVAVAGVTGDITVDGGSTIEASTVTSGANVTLGATTVAKDNIVVNHAKQAAGTIAIDGGKNVTVTATGVTTGAVNVGQGGAATDLPSGAVSITSTGADLEKTALATGTTLGAIKVDGGSTVTIKQTATSSAAAAATDATFDTITQSAVTVDGGDATTKVSVTQSAAQAGVNAVAAAAGSNETAKFTFADVATGTIVTIGGLSFTAAKALKAAEVADAFANLSAGATQGKAPASNGVYNGTFTADYASGAVVSTVVGATTTYSVTATATATGNQADLTGSTTVGLVVTPIAPVVVDGTASATAKTGVAAIVGGAVAVTDNGKKVIADVTLDGFGAGSTVVSDALTKLTLANSNEDVTVTNAAATTLALNLNAVGKAADKANVNLGGTYTTLNIATSTVDSAAIVAAAGVQNLNVSGTKAVDLTGSTFALKTVTVTGSAGVTVDATSATSVDASGTSGNNTVSVNATNATYTGGSGSDKVTLSTNNVAKAVSLGAGDDSVALFAGTNALTAAIDGGTGTDTIMMDAADAAAASLTATFETKIDGFEKLSLRATGVATSVDLSNLDDINYVVSAGITAGSLTLDKFGANGTLELTGPAAGFTTTAKLADATGTADSFNIVTKLSTLAADYGNVAVAGVETVNLSVNDLLPAVADGGVQTATIKVTDAALKTLNITGNANLMLSLDNTNVALTKIDASAATGKLNIVTVGAATAATTVIGGSAADSLTANHASDVLQAGAGADTLIVAADLVTLTGGAGNDTFSVGFATSNVNAYASITDLASGDVLKFAATAANFKAGKVSLGDTAVFQDYANSAINGSTVGDVSWFQFGGNTYVVQNMATVTSGTVFENGTDIIVKIVGAVDLSHASFSNQFDTLQIA